MHTQTDRFEAQEKYSTKEDGCKYFSESLIFKEYLSGTRSKIILLAPAQWYYPVDSGAFRAGTVDTGQGNPKSRRLILTIRPSG